MDWGKVPKYVGPGCSPFPPPVKKSLLVMLVDASANSYIEFADVKILLLFCQLFCSSANNINKSMIFHNIHVNLSASSLLVLCLFITYPCFFFIFHQVVGKPFRFIDNVLQASESFLNESNFPSSLSVFPFWAIARENVQAISV